MLLSSCGVYKKYDRPTVNTKGLYRDIANDLDTLVSADTTTLGSTPWREVFTDPKLQALIDSALVNNSVGEDDLKTDEYMPGIDINDCAKVSRYLGKWLDKEDFIKEAYTLEVCSKGFLNSSNAEDND